MKVVVNALIGATPSIVNVLMVCLIFWLIFAIIGVNMFRGKYFKCANKDTPRNAYSAEIIPDREACEIESNRLNETGGNPDEYVWTNSWVTFDNTMMAYLALLQVSTWKGWIDVMNDAIDSVDIGGQPSRYNYTNF